MTKGYRVIDSRTSKLVVVRTVVFEESNKFEYVQVVDGHLSQTYGTRIDRDHDEDVQVYDIVSRVHVDVEMEETQQPSSTSPIDVSTTHDMDMDIEDNALTKDSTSTDLMSRERRYADDIIRCGTPSGR